MRLVIDRPPSGPRTLRFCFALLAVTFFAVTGGARASAPDDFFGTDGEAIVGHPTLPQSVATMAAGGLQVVRANAQAQSHDGYWWLSPDLLEESAAPAGLRWYPFIGYTPVGDGCCGPVDPMAAPASIAAFTDYAAALARRYGRGGYFWDDNPELPYLPVTSYEVWNEENAVTFWHPQADAPERYADLYAATRAAIKAVDPSATVVVGGLALGQPGEATDEIQFLQRMFAHRPDLKVDAVGLHPYQRTVADVYARIAKFRQALDQLAGPPVPIEITEVGWSRLTTSEGDRSANLRALAMDLPRSDCNIDRLISFNWFSDAAAGGTDSTFGIAYTDGSPMPSGQAYMEAAKTMRGLSSTPAPSGTVKICHPDPTAVTRTARVRPRLRLRVIKDRRHSRVHVIARCAAGCRLRTELFAVRHGSHRLRRLAVKRSGLSRRKRRYTLHVPHRARRVQVRVLATGRDGGRTIRKRAVRMRGK